MGPAGPVALDGLFIKDAMRDYNIDEDEYIEFSTTVRRIAGHVLNAQYEEANRKSGSK